MIFQIILLLQPIIAPLPPVPKFLDTNHYSITCDYAVINTVITYDEKTDVWGRPSWVRDEKVWISFWERDRSFFIPILIHRGWWHPDSVNILKSNKGFVFESRDRIHVTVPEIHFVISTFDYEMRMRNAGKCLYMPIAKP